jgi:GNAT superfamily N-acetyltransferase
MALNIRLATDNDIEPIWKLIQLAIDKLLGPCLSIDQLSASREFMGLDTQLIQDQTYFIVLDGDEIVGCGGWSRRITLFGSDHTKGRDSSFLDPVLDAARIRAMYTHPNHVRRGIARLIISICEQEAASQGFSRCELMSTLSGFPLYKSCGYQILETLEVNGVPLFKMEKSL